MLPSLRDRLSGGSHGKQRSRTISPKPRMEKGLQQLGLVDDDGVANARSRYYESEFDTEETETESKSGCSTLDLRASAFDHTKIAEYPKSVIFIISTEFCERFNFYGMRAILVLYLTQKLGYNEETSTILFHIFTTMVYIFPLMGALIADGWLGKYRTILYLSVVYSLGTMIVAFGAIPINGMPVELVTFLGLFLIAVGTGGIKPCVAAFGGDQFEMPDQCADLAKFFSLFYFAINAGSMISTAVTPILRADVHCFGEKDCYSLAFGVPALLMIISMIIFMAGKSRYKLYPPSGNMIFGVSHCVTSAFKGWRDQRKVNPMPHFLDYATDAVGQQMVYETKCLLKILILYAPFPIFWALSDQQGSRWTFQATHMDGSLWGFQIKPDQMQVVNPLLILAFIPLFDYYVYPLIARLGIRRPLQKLTFGLMLAAVGFFMSAAVEMRLEQVVPKAWPARPDTAHLRLYNGMPCRYQFTLTHGATEFSYTHNIEPLGMWSNLGLCVPRTTIYKIEAQALVKQRQCPNIEGSIRLQPGSSTSYFLTNGRPQEFRDGLNIAPRLNDPTLLRTLVNIPDNEGPILLRASVSSDIGINLNTANLSQLHELSHGHGELHINGKRAANFDTKNGGLYSLLVHGNAVDGYKYNMLEVVAPNSISVLWQLPQIVVMTSAEIMFSVTGLEFSFTQAPESMKSVLQACWLLSVAIGNIIVVIIAKIKFVDSQSAEFALFACIMLVNLLLFTFLARNYKYTHYARHLMMKAAEKRKLDPVLQLRRTIRASAGLVEPEACINQAYQDD